MSQVPESISFQDLQELALTAKREDVLFDPAQLRKEATLLIDLLQGLVERMNHLNPVDIRKPYVETPRFLLKLNQPL